jgi:hypothetical protein
MGEPKEVLDASTCSDLMPEPEVQQDDMMLDQGPRPTSTLLSPEQKQQLMQMITQKLASKKGNTAVQSKSSGS